MANNIVIPAHLQQHPDLQHYLQFYRSHYQHIRTRERRCHRISIYNLRLDDALVDPRVLTNTIYQRETFAFKANASCGAILRHVKTGELRYYHPCWNNAGLYDAAQVITCREDWDRFVLELRNKDYVGITVQQRQSTDWTLLWLTNLTIYVFKIQDRLLGAPPSNVPTYLRDNAGLIGLFTRKGKLYQDNLCLMRAYAVHKGHHQNALEVVAKRYLSEFLGTASPKTYRGASLADLDAFEDKFQVNITVFSLQEEEEEEEDVGAEKKVSATLVRRSLGQYNDYMYLNVFEGHFSYIKHLGEYSGSFVCPKCDKHFPKARILSSHARKCKGAETKFRFTGGTYRPTPTLAEQLAAEDITLPPELKFHPYRIVYDIETYFTPITPTAPEPDVDSSKLHYTQRHVPLSVALCTNVPNHTQPTCLRTCEQKLLEVAEPVLAEIDAKLADIAQRDPAAEKHPLHRLKKRLTDFIGTIPVIGFSSGRYDLNVLKPFLAKYFNTTTGFMIKRTNQFLVLSNDKLRFMDIQNYLAPGYSYKQYLAAYQCSGTKSFFPYDWMTDLRKLDHPALPPREAWHNQLTGTTLSEEDFQSCQNIWREKKMTTFRDWLVHYNLCDVTFFLQAVEKQSAFFRERGLDMFYDAVSLPGLTDRYLHSTVPAGTFFKLFGTRSQDLYHSFRESVCGGPAIVFHRHHEKDKTVIRPAENGPHKPCQTVEGYDANSLYLKCLGEPMPVGFYYRRRQENGFRLETFYQQSQACLEWLTFLERREGLKLCHELRDGRERKVGGRQLRVDGYDKVSNTIYQFHGCYYHGHSCHLTTAMDPEERDKRSKDTAEKDRYLSAVGTLVIMRECEWRAMKRHDPSISTLLQDITPSGPAWKWGTMTEEELKLRILSGELFGVVKVDIETPAHLKKKFSEFCPIFKNTLVGRGDVGQHMRLFAEEHELLSQPRRTLVSSFHAQKTMMITPLLRWYLQQGLRITKIYEVIQYQPSTCFKDFVSEVTEARREADRDPDKAIIASAFKLLGNSSYGRSLMRKDRHHDVKFVDGRDAKAAINSPYFVDLTAVEDSGFYEAKLRKKYVTVDLPIQIGIFVYGYAKLKLLQFYYEFLDFYLDRADFQAVTCDTDSIYIALSHSTLGEAVKPHLKQHFSQHRSQWLPTLYCAEHQTQSEEENSDGLPTLPCCQAAHRHQMREPGLWKMEAKADRIIALAPKTYICSGQEGVKVSCKGVQKRINPMTTDHFKTVLTTQQSSSVVNRGFRLNSLNQMCSYVQPKTGLSYLYIKRKVLDDGVSTVPLTL